MNEKICHQLFYFSGDSDFGGKKDVVMRYQFNEKKQFFLSGISSQ